MQIIKPPPQIRKMLYLGATKILKSVKTGRISYIHEKTESRLCAHSYSANFFAFHEKLIKETPKHCILCELSETKTESKKKELMTILVKGLKADQDSDLIPPTKKSKQEVEPEDLIPNLPFSNVPSGIMEELTEDMDDFQLAAFIASIVRQRNIDDVDTNRFLWFEFISTLMKRAKWHIELSLLLLNSGKFAKSIFDEIQNLVLRSDIKDKGYVFPKGMKTLILDITDEKNDIILWEFTRLNTKSDIQLVSILDKHGFSGKLDTLMYYEARHHVKIIDTDGYLEYDEYEVWKGPELNFFSEKTSGYMDPKMKYDATVKYITARLSTFIYTGANIVTFPPPIKRILNSFKKVSINNAFIEGYPIWTGIQDPSYNYDDRIKSLAVIKNIFGIGFMRPRDFEYASRLWERKLQIEEAQSWTLGFNNFEESRNLNVKDDLVKKLDFFSFIEPYVLYSAYSVGNYNIDNQGYHSFEIRRKLIDDKISIMKKDEVLTKKDELFDELYVLHIDWYASLYEEGLYRKKVIIFTSYLDSAYEILIEIEKKMKFYGHEKHSFKVERVILFDRETKARNFKVTIN